MNQNDVLVIVDAGHGGVDSGAVGNNLQEKNTVILAPYSTTLADMPEVFWNELVDWLKAQGFIVCTNCGSPDEKAIQGTIPLFFQ